ncbi:hypothetical protein M407DRAFT_16741 [Tulasnella calospora MUT 4182]|uniref:Uncharacterized protein n=1 Tax=Tulasnella calospora MUT 4182 TaxID=1051891 RepID=A0A0C3LL05_9AGAM|nr:hypothetical protein M407DRAFT_16741 [Tulasnella calospora MUT 4182]
MDTAEPEDEEEDESRARLQQALNQMLGSALDLGSVPSQGGGPEDGLAPADKVVKKKRKAKKKKADSNPVFRLLPGPPHRISLYEPLHQGHPLIRPAEDTEEQARERADRIVSTGVVVELGDLLKDSGARWPNKPGLKTVVPTLHIQDSAFQSTAEGLPTLLLVDQSNPGGIRDDGDETIEPRAQQSLATCCPMVHAIPSSSTSLSTHAEAQSTSKLPRTRSRKAKPHPPPAFFRPNQEWGGHSAGYAYGYPSSRPLTKSGRFRGDTQTQKYLRDKIKKAKHPDVSVLWAVPEKKASVQGTGKRTVWTTEDGTEVGVGLRVTKSGSKTNRKK